MGEMGQGNIDKKKIESECSRQVTFNKRRAGLFKKAHELSVLCDVEVGVILFSSSGKLFEFASSNMEKILTRFVESMIIKSRQPKHKQGKREECELPMVVYALKEAVEKQNQLKILGKDLTGMESQELQKLEQQLHEGLLCIKDRKEALLMQQLEQSRQQEQQIMLENKILRRQVEGLQFFYPISYPVPLQIEYLTMVAIPQDFSSPQITSNTGASDEDSETTLLLGPPSRDFCKRKMPDDETHGSNSKPRTEL